VNSMELLSRFFKKLASEMQSKANELFDKESSEAQLQQMSRTSRNLGMIRRPGTGLRSLPELMRDEQFFPKLHSRFCWILHSIGANVSILRLTLPLSFLQPLHYKELDDDNYEGLSYGEIYNTLGEDCMRGLVYNVIIGNQIIIRGNSHLKSFVLSLLKMIGRLLPKSARNMVDYSEIFLDSWQCNLLGLSAEVQIPDYVEASSYALVDISKSSHDMYTFDYMGKTTEKTTFGTELEKLMEHHLPRHIEQMILRNLQEQWLSKVKLFYTLSWILETEKDPKIKHFLKTMGLIKSDLEVLRYWIAAMKRIFSKNQQLQS